MIDTVTNLGEVVRLERKDSDHVMQNFVQYWLTHYLGPQYCIHDPGRELTGQEFQTSL